MVGFDPVAREAQRRKLAGIAHRERAFDLRRRNPQAAVREVDAVEFQSEVEQRPVAACDDVGNDRADHRLDILRGFPLGRQEGAKSLVEARLARVQSDRHGLLA